MLLAVAGGLATDTAFPNRSWWPMAYVGVALLLLALRRDSVPWAWFTGFMWGLGFFLPHLYWADEAVGEPIGWIALSVAEAALVGVFGAAWVLVRRLPLVADRLWLQPLAAAVLWVGVEQLRARWPFGGFPWGTLAFSQTDAPLVRLASVGSTVLVSGVVVVVGAVLAGALLRLREVQVGSASALFLVVATLVFAPWLVPLGTRAEAGALRVGAVQGNVPEQGVDAGTQARAVTANHAAGTEALLDRVGPGELDLVLWPESSADIDPRTDPEVAAVVQDAARTVDAPILLGTQRYLDSPEQAGLRIRYNELILWEPDGPTDLVYAKQHPVPFGEYMPHRDFFRQFTSAVDLITVDMAAGTEMGLMPVPVERLGRDVPLAVGICFEVAYDELIREAVVAGGELIVIPTNNASFGMTQESTQQLAMSRFRAVEHGRAVVQVSTVGVSGIISPNGVFQDTTGLFTAEQMAESLPLRTTLTVSDRLGQWPVLITGLAAALAVVAGLVSAVRSRGQGPRRPAPRAAGGGARRGRASRGATRSGAGGRAPRATSSRRTGGTSGRSASTRRGQTTTRAGTAGTRGRR
jgi:apolipoprotein N-acyltransferase